MSGEESTTKKLLGPRQRVLVGSALTGVAVVLLIGGALLVLSVLRGFVSTFSSVLWPLAVAGILSMLLNPPVVWMQRKLSMGRTQSVIILYILFALAVLALAALILPKVFAQLLDLVSYLPNFLSDLYQTIREQYPDLFAFLKNHISHDDVLRYQEQALIGARELIEASVPAIQQAGDRVAGFFGFVTAAAIIPIYLFYLLQSRTDYGSKLDEQLSFLQVELREDLLFLIREFVGILVAFFRGQILIGLIMGVLLAIGFSLAGLKFALLLGLGIGMLNIIPYLGTILGLGTVLPIAYYQPEGGLTLLGLCILVFIIVQVIEGYVLTPRIMGETTGLHPMTIIIAIFFWGVALDGLLGMILAIPLTAFFATAWRLAKKKYLPRLTGHGAEAADTG